MAESVSTSSPLCALDTEKSQRFFAADLAELDGLFDDGHYDQVYQKLLEVSC